jgi:hypothetical protein
MVFQAQSPDSSSRAVADLPLFVVVESEYTISSLEKLFVPFFIHQLTNISNLFPNQV